MKKLLIIFIMFFASKTSMAEWTELGSDQENGNYFYMDISKIKNVKGMERIWVLNEYKKPRSWGSLSYSSSKVLQEIRL